MVMTCMVVHIYIYTLYYQQCYEVKPVKSLIMDVI